MTPEHFNQIQADVWTECAAAYARFASDLWDWEHGYTAEKPEKPSNPYSQEQNT